MNVHIRLPVRLSAMFLILITIMGVGITLIALGIFERRQAEIDQRLNRDVATNMAAEIEPTITSGSGGESVGGIMHYMMVLNPAVEIYLLDGQGTILDYFTSPGPPVQLDRVDTTPIKDFIAGSRPLPIFGDNPRAPAESHHFSAAPIALADQGSGYLYVVLRSSGYDVAEMDLRRRYLGQALQTSILVTVPLVGILGLLLFFLATRPLQRLSGTVRAFGAGDTLARSAVSSHDEFGDLARTFNSMADTIAANVRKLEHADRERRELIANISHDIRNPLATIQGYLETLARKHDDLDAAVRDRYYEILLNTVGSLPRLVDDLFELSRLEDPGVSPQMEPLSLSELVQDVVVQWTSRAADLSIDLSANRPEGLHMIVGNAGLLERLLTNLIRNALVFTPAGGRLEVSVERRNSRVRTTVADTGPGIPEADLPHIFERFYIGDSSRSKARDGSGLGLAICKRIVELHGGTIGVRSATGAGSEFYFDVPRAGGSDRIS